MNKVQLIVSQWTNFLMKVFANLTNHLTQISSQQFQAKFNTLRSQRTWIREAFKEYNRSKEANKSK